MSEAVYERAAQLLEADLGDELVALDAEDGQCFGFNSVATEVWRQLVRPKTFTELRDMLVTDYEVSSEQCTEELQGLLNSLVEKGLVRLRSGTEVQQTATPDI